MERKDRFKVNNDGTVTDIETGLVWQHATAGKIMTGERAINYCKGLSLGGHDDWRLPNINELQSIVDYTRHNPAINITAFPDTLSSPYWSSTTVAHDTCLAWCVGFNYGNVVYGNKSLSYYVRAMRGVRVVRSLS